MIKLGTYPFVATFKEPQQLQDYADKLCSRQDPPWASHHPPRAWHRFISNATSLLTGLVRF